MDTNSAPTGVSITAEGRKYFQYLTATGVILVVLISDFHPNGLDVRVVYGPAVRR